MNIHIQRLNENRLPDLIRLAQRINIQHLELEKLQQQYQASKPALSYLGYIAYNSSGQPIAFCGARACEFTHDGRSIGGARFSELICDPLWQDKGLPKRLLRRVELLCLSLDLPVHFSLSAIKAQQDFTEHLGWALVSPGKQFNRKILGIPLSKLRRFLPFLNKREVAMIGRSFDTNFSIKKLSYQMDNEQFR